MKAVLSQSLMRILPTWVSVFTLLTVAHLIFLLRFHERSLQNFDAFEAIRVLVMAMRLDVSIASGVSAFLLAFQPLLEAGHIS